MLRTDLPKVITETVPGPKAAAMIERSKKCHTDSHWLCLSGCNRTW